jgi:hypothetical protein
MSYSDGFNSIVGELIDSVMELEDDFNITYLKSDSNIKISIDKNFSGIEPQFRNIQRAFLFTDQIKTILEEISNICINNNIEYIFKFYKFHQPFKSFSINNIIYGEDDRIDIIKYSTVDGEIKKYQSVGEVEIDWYISKIEILI